MNDYTLQQDLEGYNTTILREIRVLQELGHHQNMVSLIDVFMLKGGLKNPSPCIVIEFLEKGSLGNALTKGVGLNAAHVKNLAQ